MAKDYASVAELRDVGLLGGLPGIYRRNRFEKERKRKRKGRLQFSCRQQETQGWSAKPEVPWSPGQGGLLNTGSC